MWTHYITWNVKEAAKAEMGYEGYNSECSVSGHTLMSDHRFLRYYQVSWTINMVFMFASFDMPPNELRT